MTEEEFEELYEEPVGEDAASRNVLPEKFANPATSGFEVQVTSGENSHDFAL